MSSANWQPFCSGLNVLSVSYFCLQREETSKPTSVLRSHPAQLVATLRQTSAMLACTHSKLYPISLLTLMTPLGVGPRPKLLTMHLETQTMRLAVASQLMPKKRSEMMTSPKPPLPMLLVALRGLAAISLPWLRLQQPRRLEGEVCGIACCGGPWGGGWNSWPGRKSGAGHVDDGLVQERRNPSALAMELRLSCTNPPM